MKIGSSFRFLQARFEESEPHPQLAKGLRPQIGMYTKKQGRDGVARPQRLGRTLTPTRPYPTRISRERLAVSGWRLGTHLFQLPFERRRTASGLRSRLIG